MESLLFIKPISINNKVRLGPDSDGGYIVYKPSLNRVDVLVSYGVGWDIEFEVDFFNETNKSILMFDPTMFKDKKENITSCKLLLKKCRFLFLIRYLTHLYRWRKILKELRKDNIIFVEEGIAEKTIEKYDTFKNHIERFHLEDKTILLKVDIEENEYPIFLSFDFLSCLKNVDQIIVEFHNLKHRLRELKFIIQKLKSDFEIVHIHGNNCSGTFCLYRAHAEDITFPDTIEITFVKRDSINESDIQNIEIKYPILNLDFANNPYAPDFNRLMFD